MGNSTSSEKHHDASTTSASTSFVSSHADTPLTNATSIDSSQINEDALVKPQSTRRESNHILRTVSYESLDSAPHAHHEEHIEDIKATSNDLSSVGHLQFNELNIDGNKERIESNNAEDSEVAVRPVSKMASGEEIDFYYGETPDQYIPTLISWIHGGKKVYVTGTFTGWRKMIKLSRNGDEFSTVVNLPPGTHRIRFVVDNELRCSDALPTATDSMGNLVNYIEVSASDLPALEREGALEEEKFEETASIAPLEYTNEIPEMFQGPDRYIPEDCPAPPYLPPHLETVILNTNSTEKDDSSVLPIPNHVVLNHLATTSIKHNVLAVASVSRYHRKYVTQILYAPL
ncbi:5'-AMP-activated protein kinase beta subunit, interation domain-containing protein [Lipomyces japonicus]|uniref:5'-AMP-activated protein kinase beta subunit, interation domain-containing protein n=1 Tax=Lipomyces japonicus TaxID=56871 RepID=UPI0034CDA23E